MNKILAVISSIGILFSAFALPTFAAGKSAPKATGDYGYMYGIQRYAQFDAQQTSTVCSAAWNVNGNNSVVLTGAYIGYVYSVTFAQSGTTLTGNLTDPYFSSTSMPVTGTLTGNTITFSYEYPDNGYRGVRTFTGTINPSGMIAGGTWSETGSEGISGTWTNETAFVNGTTGCTGKGTFNYSDVNGTFYTVDVKYVSVDGNRAWFAGPIVAGNFGNSSQWLFVKVVDNGEPGINDTSTGDFPVTQSQALLDVVTHADPTISPITIDSGNIQVH